MYDLIIIGGEQAERVERTEGGFRVTTKKGAYETKTIFLASGSRRRKLDVSGKKEFEGKGVFYCSICDAPVMKGKKAAVIGGGNSGLEAVIDLVPYAEEIYLIESNGKLRGDQMTQDEIRKNPKLKEIIFHAQALEVLGDKFVNGLKYRNKESGDEKVLSAEGIFVEIGSVPNSEIAKDLVGLDQYGQVIIDSKNATTTHPGVFAAGDITDDPYKQNNISAGDAVKAALAAYNYLLKREKHTPAAA